MKAPSPVWMDKFLNWSFAISFLVIIFLPFLSEQFNLRTAKSLTENRRLTERPSFKMDSLSFFPLKYEKYYNDNFSFRNFFVQLNSRFSAKTYGISAIPDILIGKEGWLYYVAKSQGNSLEDYKGLVSVDRRILELIRENLEQRTRTLKSQGIQFVVIVAPDKQTIYPEYLPESTKRPRRYPTRLDQIVEYLKKHSTVQILDVRKELLKEKEKGRLPLYKKTDSHWNNFGGFIAYQQILRSLSMEPKLASDFEWKQANQGRGDLANMLALDERITEENQILFTTSFENEISFQEKENNYGTSLEKKSLIATNKDKALPKLLVFQDSFGEALLKFLSYHFRESVFIQSDSYSSAIIEKESPDVVIFEIVERYAPFLADGELK